MNLTLNNMPEEEPTLSEEKLLSIEKQVEDIALKHKEMFELIDQIRELIKQLNK